MNRRAKIGFTLMELLMVIVIIGILAGLLMPVLQTSKTRAKTQRARAEAGQLETALRSYFMDNRDWDEITVTESSSALVKILRGETSKSKIPYMEFSNRSLNSSGDLMDPWGNKYRIGVLKKGNTSFKMKGSDLYRVCGVWSAGADGKFESSNNATDDDDVVSWK